MLIIIEDISIICKYLFDNFKYYIFQKPEFLKKNGYSHLKKHLATFQINKQYGNSTHIRNK